MTKKQAPPAVLMILPVAELKPWERNPRKHDVDRLMLSIQEFGFRAPLVVNKTAQGYIVEAGHGRLKAAIRLGMKELPCVVVEDDEKVAMAYAIADNRQQELTEYVMSDYKDILQELDDGSIDMSAIGFTEEELADLMTQFHVDGEDEGLTDDDAVPDEAPPVCKLGEIWQLGEHRLMCGDSTKAEDVALLMDGQKADMVFTDPPFEMSGMGYMPLCLASVTGAVLVMHSDANMMRLAHEYASVFHYCLVHYYSFGFVRSNSMPQLAHHLIGVFGKPSFRSQKDGFKTVICEQLERGKLMPYQKRVAIPEQCIAHYSSGAVLDVFGGSGSTLIACEKLDRHCYMMELEPKFCDVIIKRWEDFSGGSAGKS